MGRPRVYTMVIVSRLSAISQVVETVMARVEPYHYGENARFAIRLALDEGLSNAIRHGNRNNPRKSVTVRYSVNEQRVRVSICDEGPGFTPGAVPDCTLEENLCRPGGRGVMLMKAYMTSVRFNAAGNCVTLVKKRKPAAPAARRPRGGR